MKSFGSNISCLLSYTHTYRQAGRQAGRQTDRQTDRQKRWEGGNKSFSEGETQKGGINTLCELCSFNPSIPDKTPFKDFAMMASATTFYSSQRLTV